MVSKNVIKKVISKVTKKKQSNKVTKKKQDADTKVNEDQRKSKNSKSKIKEYDLIVIGSGGGTQISSPAFDKGYNTALIEESKLGGTCLNRGCIPSKMLIHPANIAQQIKEAKKFDINATFKSANLQKLLRRINKETDGDSAGIKTWYDQRKKGFGFYEGHGKFVGDKIIKVNDELITAKKIFIATGARPFIPAIPGLKGTPFMTSTQALRSRTLPKKLIVIGGGYIGCELGHAYSALGSEMHMIVKGDKLLQREDKQVSDVFTKIFSKKHNMHFNVNTDKIEYKNKKFTLYLKDNNGKRSTISGDALLIATGVSPNTDKLGLENTQIKTNKR